MHKVSESTLESPELRGSSEIQTPPLRQGHCVDVVSELVRVVNDVFMGVVEVGNNVTSVLVVVAKIISHKSPE